MGKVIQGKFRNKRTLDVQHTNYKYFIIPLLGVYFLIILELVYFFIKGVK